MDFNPATRFLFITLQATDNYYTLKEEPYNPVLPSYEECVKMDKHYFASLHTPSKSRSFLPDTLGLGSAVGLVIRFKSRCFVKN